MRVSGELGNKNSPPPKREKDKLLIVSPLRVWQSVFKSIVLFILATLVDANVIEDLQIVKHLGKKIVLLEYIFCGGVIQ